MLIQTPPALTGDERQQLVQLRSYLYQMSEALNHGLTTLTVENFQPEARKQLQAYVSDEQVDASIHKAAATLKAMIIKTASEIKVSMDEITTKLEGDYLAISQFGKYTEQVSAEITATATGIIQSYDYGSRLDAADEALTKLDNAADGFSSYITNTEAYIKTGQLYVDDENVPIYGVGVSQYIEQEVDGELIKVEERMATFTANRLAFWQNGKEVAWISNGQWQSSAIKVTGEIYLGDDKWKIDQTNGFSIRWVGQR